MLRTIGPGILQDFYFCCDSYRVFILISELPSLLNSICNKKRLSSEMYLSVLNDVLNFVQYRCVDELESQLSKHGSLKKLYFYHQHLTAVCYYLRI